MSIDDIVKTSVCSKLQSEVDAIFGPLEKAQTDIFGKVNEAKDFLNQMSFSPGKIVHDQCSALLLNYNLDRMVPSLSKMDQIVDIINSCSFLKNNSSLKYPSAVANGILGDLKSGANNIINEITGGLPEFDAGKMLKSLTDQIKTNKIDLGINNITSGLDCMKGICGIDITSRLQRLQSFLDMCYFNFDGEFDINKLFTDAGMNFEQMLSMDNVMRTYDKIYDRIEESVDNSIAAATGEFDKITDLAERAYAETSALYDKGMELFADTAEDEDDDEDDEDDEYFGDTA